MKGIYMQQMDELDRQHMLQTWEKLNATERFQVKYPHERVVSWTFRNFPRSNAENVRLLDLGCGAGRHALFWLKEGYQAAATDIAQSAVAVSIARAEMEGLQLDAKVCGADAIHYDDASFDGLLSFGVLCYLGAAELRKAFSEIFRVLKPGGKALIVLRGLDDDRCRRAVPLGDNMYRLVALGEGAASEAESGMVMTFLAKEDIHRLAAPFAAVAVDHLHFSESDGRFLNADWYIQLQR